MTMNRNTILVSILIASLGAAALPAAMNENAGTRGETFMRIDPSARVSGLGGAFASIDGEAACVDANPAGLAGIKCAQIATTYGKWFADTNYGNIGFGMPLGRGAIGLSLTYLDYGTLVRTTGQDNFGVPIEDGSFNASDMNVSAAYARAFELYRHRVSLGAAAKVTRLAIDGNYASGYGLDLGLDAALWWGVNFGAACRNLGNLQKMEQNEEQLPQEFDVGLSRRLFVNPDQAFLVSVDGAVPLDNSLKVKGGMEYAFKEMLFFRAGYRGNYDTDWLTMGAGFAYNGLKLDYAYAPYNVLGDTHRVTLTFYLGKPCRKNRPEKIRVLDLSVLSITRTGAMIAWEDPKKKKGTRYEVSLSRDAFAADSSIAVAVSDGLTDQYTTLTGLSPETRYSVRVRAFDRKQLKLTGLSNTAVFKTAEDMPGAVNGLTGVALSTSAITWDWDAHPKALSYNIYVDGGITPVMRLQAGVTSWIETGLEQGTKYTRTITASSNAGEGAHSAPASATTLTVNAVLAQTINSLAEKINFDNDSAVIRDADKPGLDRIAALIEEYKPFKVRVEGHTDNTGDPAHNVRLSQQRAESVKEYLESKGHALLIMTAEGFGGARPIADNLTEEGRLANRRVELVIVLSDGKEIRTERK